MAGPAERRVAEERALSADATRPNSRTGGAADAPSAALAPAHADIVVTNVHKTFGVTRALDGCSFSARFGEIHAIVGGNGCGKSTLAKVLSGVLPVDSGQVVIMGHTPTTPRDARQIGVATVFQEVLVADDCSVLDNLFVGVDSLWTKSLPTREKYRTAEAIMRDLTGLDIDPDALVGPLLLSIKQWITIGRALLCRPKVLILDESSAALDFDSTEKLFEKMRALRDAGAAVLIVTHRIAELIRVSDRATVLRDGRDVGVLGRGEITEENLLRLMTGKGPSAEAGERSAAESAGGDTVLRARGLKVWPGGPDVDFALRRGEIVGVAGLDGQGQNEFVRVLAGVQPAVAGVPEVRGATGNFGPVRDLDDADRAGVAYVSGDRKREGIFPNLSVFENLLIALYPKALRGRVAGIIDWASLGTVFDSNVEKLSVKLGLKSDKVTSLSGGNQQKVLIGRAFALGPRILVLNDPARGIDVEAKRELYGHLRDFAARGNAVVFLSSELEEFIGLCQRVIVFRHGGVFDTFVGEDVDAVRILEAMFGHAVAHGRPTARPESARRAPSRPRQDDAPRVETAPIRATPRPPTEIRVVDFEAKRPANGGVDRADDGKHIKIVYSDS